MKRGGQGRGQGLLGARGRLSPEKRKAREEESPHLRDYRETGPRLGGPNGTRPARKRLIPAWDLGTRLDRGSEIS